jgi:O-acetyl-ADP-ribose deacetylase (regulator of RNase III)
MAASLTFRQTHLPEHVPASHAYRALRAALRAAAREPEIGDLYCPGLATGVGGVEPIDAAREMMVAYADAMRAGA